MKKNTFKHCWWLLVITDFGKVLIIKRWWWKSVHKCKYPIVIFFFICLSCFFVFSGSILSSCQSQTPSCSKGACLHGGTCREGWNRATCDCTLSGYVGSACHRAAAVLHLTGHEYMRVAAASSQADIEEDDINIRYVDFDLVKFIC